MLHPFGGQLRYEPTGASAIDASQDAVIEVVGGAAYRVTPTFAIGGTPEVSGAAEGAGAGFGAGTSGFAVGGESAGGLAMADGGAADRSVGFSGVTGEAAGCGGGETIGATS